MANLKTLKRNTDRSPEELAAMGRKGGLAAAENRKRKKDLRESLSAFLDAEVKVSAKDFPEEISEVLRKKGIKRLTLREKAALTLALKMSCGDLRAMLLGAKIVGEYNEALAPVDVDSEEGIKQPQPILIQVGSAAEAEELSKIGIA